MEEVVSDPKALRCPLCQKSFSLEDKRRASKHFSYCRRKHLSSPGPRRKACDECVRSKVRCNYDSSGCSRCVTKGKICTYSGRVLHNSDLRSSHGAGSQLVQESLSESNGLAVSDHLFPPFDEFGSGFTPFITTMPGGTRLSNFATWDDDVFDNDFPDMPDIMTPVSGNYHLGVVVEASNPNGETQDESESTTASTCTRELQTSIPASLPHHDLETMFERRQLSKPELEVTGDLALHTLRSYLYVIADQDTVPPFIHPRYQDWMEVGTNRPSPLYAAIKLAKMLFLGHRMNKTLIWRLIRIEQERLLIEHPKFGKWELLEALQSLILYVMMRITEGRHDYTNFDTQLLISVYVGDCHSILSPDRLSNRKNMKAVCRHIATSFGNAVNFDEFSSDEFAGGLVPWKEWVFFESRRRCAIVYLIIDGILHTRVSDPSPNMPEFTFAPAPSPGSLWGAKTETDWAVSHAGHLSENATYGSLTNRDLVALKESTGKQHDRWYASADSFGLLATLVADLIF